MALPHNGMQFGGDEGGSSEPQAVAEGNLRPAKERSQAQKTTHCVVPFP